MGWMTGRRRASVPALGLVVALAALNGAAQDQPERKKRSWIENFDYRVEVGGALSPVARLFSGNGRPAMLLLAPEFKEALVLIVDGREVQMADTTALEMGPAPDQVQVNDMDIHGPPLPYTMNDNVVIFFVDGRKVTLTRKPPLIGPTTEEEVLAHLPIYRKGMQEYTPTESDVVYLKSYKLPVKIEIFFGSWCPHCKEIVPRFLKSVESAANTNLELAFHGVPTGFSDYAPAQQKKVKGVPTFIVYGADKEIGRITTFAGDSSVEHELVKILFAYEQSRK